MRRTEIRTGIEQSTSSANKSGNEKYKALRQNNLELRTKEIQKKMKKIKKSEL